MAVESLSLILLFVLNLCDSIQFEEEWNFVFDLTKKNDWNDYNVKPMKRLLLNSELVGNARTCTQQLPLVLDKLCVDWNDRNGFEFSFEKQENMENMKRRRILNNNCYWNSYQSYSHRTCADLDKQNANIIHVSIGFHANRDIRNRLNDAYFDDGGADDGADDAKKDAEKEAEKEAGNAATKVVAEAAKEKGKEAGEKAVSDADKDKDKDGDASKDDDKESGGESKEGTDGGTGTGSESNPA